MKLAILTSARTGSTSLFHMIEAHLLAKKYICISEPFNDYWRDRANYKSYDINYFESNSKNIFIKTFVSRLQKPKWFIHNDSAYWDWFFNYFDKIILLDRIDKVLQSESLSYHMKKDDMLSWQSRQFYDLSNITQDEINNSKDVLINESKLLYSFSEKGYPLYYYEDIYLKKDKSLVESMFNYLDIELNEDLYNRFIYEDSYKIRLNSPNDKFKSLI
jgi:hypothetical protein